MLRKYESRNYAILIATRNRPAKLATLLESICNLTLPASQIVIAASGESVDNQIALFTESLNVSYLHLEERGQIRQKKAGLKLISPNIDWVLFLDDDVVLEKDSVMQAFQELENLPIKDDVVGIGFKDRNFHEKSISRTKRIMLKFFGVSNQSNGKVLSNGQNMTYMNSTLAITTEWLNGISLWKKNIAGSYDIPFLEARYSICEDLIFSYNARNKGRLIFSPQSFFAFQDSPLLIEQGSMIFRATAYWKLYFVMTHSNLSVVAYLWAQIGRSLYFAINSPGRFAEKLSKFRFSMIILFDLFYLVVRRVPAIEILKLRQSD